MVVRRNKMSVSLSAQILDPYMNQVDEDEDIKKRLNKLSKDDLIDLVMRCKRSLYALVELRKEENMPW
jgi:hypothetical protein